MKTYIENLKSNASWNRKCDILHDFSNESTLNFFNLLQTLSPIPRIVHVTWKHRFDFMHSENPMVKEGIRHIAEQNPDWRVELSDDRDMIKYLRQKLRHEDYERVKNAHIVEQSDLWRLLKICHEGGLYMDIDRLSNRPISEYIRNTTRMVMPTFNGFSCKKSRAFNIAQDFQCSAAGNPVFCCAVEQNIGRRAALQKAQTSYNLYELGPPLLMNVARSIMLGRNRYRDFSDWKQMWQTFSAIVSTYEERPPHDTIQYQNTEHTSCDWFHKARDQFRKHHKVMKWN